MGSSHCFSCGSSHLRCVPIGKKKTTQLPFWRVHVVCGILQLLAPASNLLAPSLLASSAPIRSVRPARMETSCRRGRCAGRVPLRQCRTGDKALMACSRPCCKWTSPTWYSGPVSLQTKLFYRPSTEGKHGPREGEPLSAQTQGAPLCIQFNFCSLVQGDTSTLM